MASPFCISIPCRGRRGLWQAASRNSANMGLAVKIVLFSLLIVATAAEGLPGAALAQDKTAPATDAWNSFDASYVLRVTPPAKARKVRARIPLPSSDQFQIISQLQLKAPAGVATRKDSKSGDRYAYLTVDTSRIQGPFEIRVVFRVYRIERHPDLAAATDSPNSYPNDVAAFLQPDVPTPANEAFLKLARAQTETLSDPLDKARGIYDLVVSLRSDSDSRGQKSDEDCHSDNLGCADANSLFVQMARAVGVPARLQIGFVLPQGQKEGMIAHARTWSEFFIGGVGWVPVDASENDQRLRAFGAIDNLRVMISAESGTNLQGANAELVATGAYPSVEVDGVPCADYSTTDFFFHETGFTSTSAFKKTIFAAIHPVIAGATISFPS